MNVEVIINEKYIPLICLSILCLYLVINELFRSIIL